MKNDNGSPRLYNIVQSPQSSKKKKKGNPIKNTQKQSIYKNEVFCRPHRNQLTTVISHFIPSNLVM